MPTPVVLSNGRQWDSREDALRHFAAVLDRYRDGDPITGPADADDLAALFVRYENWLLRRFPPKNLEEAVTFSRQRVISDGSSYSAFFFHLQNGASREFNHGEAITRPWATD